ncbi:hypothetical protein [Glutamicibacter sp. NPDC087344]|uniref:hypothetical protein n=1 Tax=Glutamicibacter sp. NPDC087344 TaxID=3363994 RepID=UPI0038288AC5
MNIEALLTALHTLCASPHPGGTRLAAGMLVRLGALCLSLFTAIGRLVHESNDPRLVLAHAQLVENMAQQVHYQQLGSALDAELTGAANLSLETFDAVRAQGCDFDTEAEFTTSRPCYPSAADLLAAWLSITYFEAQRRIEDAHLLIGRRNVQGTICAPRFEHLAQLYAQGNADRRLIASTARSLAKLEKPDTTFEGMPSELAARAPDGKTLEEHAAQALEQLGPVEARKRISTQIKLYKQLHQDAPAPPLGLFVGPVIRGVHTFALHTLATHAEFLRSLAAQAGSKRGRGGAKARQEDAAPAEQAGQAAPPDPAQDAADPPTPPWLRPESPMPDWASEPESGQGGAEDEHDEQDEPADTEPDEDTTDADPEQDEPDPGQEPSAPLRRLNALMDILCTATSGGKKKTIVPKILVYLWLKDLKNLATAHGITAHGVDIPPGELRQLLAAARVIPLVLGGNSQPIDVGRSRRFHRGTIKMAVMARDRGCIVPECTTPPDLVEIDHYKKPWSEGGTTSVDSGAAMCSNEHHGRHAGHLKVVDVDGLPHVVLPPHVDPEQKPRRNTYWGALQLDDEPEQPGEP